jgi:hypothetical protein
MSAASPLTLPQPETPARSAAAHSWTATAIAWSLLFALLAVNLPAFICMGLDSDILMYDLIARRVLAGDVHYRDLLETNFPGIIWLHMTFRSLFGWRSEALRAVDFVMVAASIGLLVRWLPRESPAWSRIFTAIVLFAFYLSTSEWCHCQRDIWMLLPALIALAICRRQVGRLTDPKVGALRLAAWSALEGALWAAACWIKPFVAVPALAAWLIAARKARPSAGIGRLATDFAGLLVGGLAVGAAGVGWLVATGAWPAFYEVMFIWNREYFTHKVHGAEQSMAPIWFAVRFFPWVLVHVFAIPIALAAVCRGREGPVSPLLAGFYLAWLLQAIALQHLFDYVHVPPLFLGLAVFASYGLARVRNGGGRPVLGFAVICVLWSGYATLGPRLAAWNECLSNGSTPEVRDQLTIMRRVSWTDLGRVAEFLREQDVHDGEVTSFSLSTVALYGELNLPPSTRYIFLQDHLDIFVSRRPVIHDALVASRQRFVVCDLKRYGMQTFRDALDREGSPPVDYPWADRIVFRAGSYVVYRLSGAEMPAWLATHFGQ